jgi:GntR family transcriptional regulator
MERAESPGPVAAELGLEDGDPVIALERLRFVDGVPWVLVTTYMPYELCPQLLGEDMSERSLYDLIEEEYGIYISYGRRSVEAVSATPELAQQLQVEEGDPVLMLRSTSYGEDNRPIEYFVAYHRGDHTRFEVTLARHRNPGGDPAGAGRLPNVVSALTDGHSQKRG